MLQHRVVYCPCRMDVTGGRYISHRAKFPSFTYNLVLLTDNLKMDLCSVENMPSLAAPLAVF